MFKKLFLFICLLATAFQFAHAEETKILSEQLERFIPFHKESSKPIGYLVIDSESGIDKGTWVYVKTALDYFLEKKPSFIVVEINSPGGELSSCQKIADALRSLDLKEGIPSIAVINNRALSGGALIAYSCRFIYSSEDGFMGAATPVYSGANQGMVKAPEKLVSVVRAEFGNAARLFGRSPAIAEAMVDESLTVIWRKGKAKVLKAGKEIRDSDVVISEKGKLLTLNTKQMLEFDVVDGKLPLQSLTKKTSSFEDLTLSSNPYFEKFAKAPLIVKPKDWKVDIIVFLSSSAISSILLLGLMLGAYIEFQTPGFGVPGALAVLCLCLLSIASFSLDALHWVDYALLMLGLILLCIELFVIPGFGIIGALGIVLFFAGASLIFLPSFAWLPDYFNSGESSIFAESFFERLWWLIGTFFVFIALLVSLSKYLQKNTKALSHLVLSNAQNKSEGFAASMSYSEELISKQGEASTILRPAGKVLIDGKLYDAQSEGTFISKGSPIKVISMRGKTLIVELIKDR